MKDIVALCKRRGFVFPASDIYGGINGFWDYGPLGVELKNNLRDLWWKHMVITPPVGPDGQPVDIVGIDSAIIQNPKAWLASGHVGGFSDPMVDCRETKLRYRADHLVVYVPKNGEGSSIAIVENTEEDAIARRIKNLSGGKSPGNFEKVSLTAMPKEALANIIGPDTKTPGTLTEPRQFNLMFHTFVGATAGEENKAYLRPETAQGIFLNFKNVVDSSRVRVPFGIAQIGKAFRNEVTPRNFIFRSREFEQMEMEWFCHPSEAKTWRDFWFAERQKFWTSIGLSGDNIRMRDHERDELSHYAKEGYGTADIEYRFPFTAPGFGELEGIAHRCDFDLKQHQEHSGTKLEYVDPVTNERFVPHVIEPAAGLTRGVLALLCEAYTVDPNRPAGMFMNFHPSIAPRKAAILPLTAKGEHVPLATELYMNVREHYSIDLDIKQNIGKRYARQDEIGTPFCFTIDDQTAQDRTVTVRHRNTMKQDRIAIGSIREYMAREMALM
ncbi:MAG: glycine--tRNA ligase, partial [Pseudomonadota bacterium]|nr:glycine--tRNA ligase [Pseudomonadota bacterium]